MFTFQIYSKLEGIKMHNCLNRFIDNLIQQYYIRSDMTYVQYDGSSAPIILDDVPEFRMDSDEIAEKVDCWSGDYLSSVDHVHYYSMYQTLIKDVFNIWVNPTREDLMAFNMDNDLDPLDYLENFESLDRTWSEKLSLKAKAEFEVNGYKLIVGSELIEQFVRRYDKKPPKNLTLVDWLEPVNISGIDLDSYYVFDLEVVSKPILFDDRFLLEQDNQQYRITPNNLKHYLDHVIVTQRGLSSRKVVEDKSIEFRCYYSMIHYLKMNPCETKESTFRKLLEDAVDPAQPFIEAITDNMGEVYINNASLKSEKAILDFINLAYMLEELDLEAKSFDRKKIMEGKLNQTFPKTHDIKSASIKNMHKQMSELHSSRK